MSELEKHKLLINVRAWDGENFVYSQNEFRDTQTMLSVADILKSYENVMFSFGMRDRNGKVIYDRDLLKCSDGKIRLMIQTESEFIYTDGMKLLYTDEVVGNLYQNLVVYDSDNKEYLIKSIKEENLISYPL
jgi:hypothetical protein